MTAAIRVLPRLVVDQIAAGEVVDRPAAVVRELVDNAIDAGARFIEVAIEGGGRTRIGVSDDGAGIPRDDLPLAFASHATSKLEELGDLDHIATLGFRGEALASIGAVARARIRSRVDGEPTAFEVDDEGGAISPPRPAARARGTDVDVRDLFFNVPARRRFLRRDSTEAGHALDVVVRQALARPEIAFRATVDGRTAFDAPARGGDAAAARRERVRAAFGDEVHAALRALPSRGGAIALEGFVCGPEVGRRDASGVHLFVNGRFVRDRGALGVMREATRDFFGPSQPVAFLFLAIDPAQVDVNVHPAKLEVRFREPGAVYGGIHRAVREALESARPVAGSASRLLDLPAARALEGRPWIAREPAPPATYEPARERVGDAPPRPAAATSGDLFAREPAEPLVPRGARFLRAFDTFLVFEAPDGLEIVDQHALHERVNFEILRARHAAGAMPRQTLLVPEVLEVPAGDLGLVEEMAEAWCDAGFEVEPYGPSSVAVRALPAGLKRLRPRALLDDLLALARERERPGAGDLLEEILHRCACRASVMAGDVLSDSEIESLLGQAARLPADQTCPHGRPTRIRVSKRDLERAFERS